MRPVTPRVPRNAPPPVDKRDSEWAAMKTLLCGTLAACAVAAFAGALIYRTAPDRPQVAAYQDRARSGDGWFGELLRFNRNREDGESAENFIYALCKGAAASASIMPSFGWDDVSRTLNGGRDLPTKSADQIDSECRSWARSSGAKWVKADSKPFDWDSWSRAVGDSQWDSTFGSRRR